MLNHGLHYASCVFEGIRVYDKKIFKLHEHIQRLFKSAELLDLNISYKIDKIININLELIEKQKIVNGYIRPVVWRGGKWLYAKEEALILNSSSSGHLIFLQNSKTKG